jgi:hypothetical protein
VKQKKEGAAMNWKFWQKKTGNEAGSDKVVKLPGPKRIPETVGRHLVVRLNQEPDWVWSLECVVRPRGESNSEFDVRVFDKNRAADEHVVVKDFNTLDAHPNLVLYEGWFDKKTMEVKISAGEAATPRAA